MKTNYGAIVVSAVAYWLLGALWYGVLFSQRWMALEGITMEQARSMNPVLPYVITLGLNLLIAFVLAQLCLRRNANTAARGAAVALDFALETLNIADPALRARLMNLYLTLDAFPEVPAMLQRLKAAGLRTAILSNGSPHMLRAAVDGAGIGALLDPVLSVEEVGVYKPHPRVYGLA